MVKRILDLFCGAGGAAMGLHQAWPEAEIIGVDMLPQPRYPFNFIQCDAFQLTLSWSTFDFIWASPPCQLYSASTREWRAKGREYPDLIARVREQLPVGIPSVIENVVGAPLINPIMLCGSMFGLKVYRHRLFETSVRIDAPLHPVHTIKQAKVGRPPRDGEFCNPVGHFPNLAYHRSAMGVDWMNKKELSQAIPPAYSEFIGRQLI